MPTSFVFLPRELVITPPAVLILLDSLLTSEESLFKVDAVNEEDPEREEEEESVSSRGCLSWRLDADDQSGRRGLAAYFSFF